MLRKIDGVSVAEKEGQDLYAFIASKFFDVPYAECLEWKEGNPYIKGQSRRKFAKMVILLMFYARYYPKHINKGIELMNKVITGYSYDSDVKG
jgi:hypothetical protein